MKTRIKIKTLQLDQTKGSQDGRQAKMLNNQKVLNQKNRSQAHPKETSLSQNHLNKPKGKEYPFDVSKPLPLIMDQGGQVLPVDFFINNDLKYLRRGSSSKKYTNSTTKTKAAKYDIPGIEDMVPLLWSPVKEGDFPRLHLHDIEDMMLLLVQKKLSNLEKDVIFDLGVALRMFTRRFIILKRVEYLQMGVKSYQKKLNITKPETFRPKVNTARAKAVLNAVQGNQGNPQLELQEKVVIDSRCSRHMTKNMSYLSEYEEINGGYVSFGGDPKRGKITGKGKISTGIKREFNVARTPQQNGVAKKNRTLIEAARPMIVDLKLPTTFWAVADNIACYAQNRVLVIKPHNKTPYELFHGRTPILSFMRPFGCPVIILNTLDPLGMFDGKADEEFFVGNSMNSKAFRVFNSRTRIVEETLHITFLEKT
nr:retrovirus-related Pol polyprotein from transposon TNT 1-94 [Tanacetum cinerariifolium]